MRKLRASTVVGILAAGACTCAALSLARVVRAEAAALKPVFYTPKPGMHPALVVFGCETLPTGPSRELSARLSHAHWLWRHDVAKVIVVSGGVDGELDEVTDMTTFLIEAGVPSEAIIQGRPGGNTRETISTMARLGVDEFLGPWIAVSTPFHARRIRDEALRAGIDVVVSGPKDSPETLDRAVHRSRVITEAIATVYYLLPLAVTARVRTSTGTLRHRLPWYLAGRPGDITPLPEQFCSS
jgi:uncharacterized SAM-binding protein YcdF (DUF218 family)